jgi:selenocysteine lyase/cysteine desulfurase
VDFAAADAHKWLLGPLGTAILYVRREHFDRLRPPLVGWHNALCPDFVSQNQIKFWPDARRYEPGSSNLAGIVGLHAALGLIHEVGMEVIESRVLELVGQGIKTAKEAGFNIVGPSTADGRSGIVSITSQIFDCKAINDELAASGIVVSLRRQRDGTQCLRLSPHFYNKSADLQRFFASFAGY